MEQRSDDDQQRPGITPDAGATGPPTHVPEGEPLSRDRERSEALVPDVLEPGEDDDRSGPGGGIPFGGGPGGMFEPRSFAGGRVQVVGCSPGCLIVSLVVSVLLSVVLTLFLNAIF